MNFTKYMQESIHVLESVSKDVALQDPLQKIIQTLLHAVKHKKPILICGNGGSASDAEHFAAELVGRFLLNRPAIKAYALTTTGATMTALSNDFGYENVFARQVEAYGEEGGVLIGITTSGKSKNVLHAMNQAQQMGMNTIALVGEFTGALEGVDHILSIPSHHTPFIQQAHLCLYHFICDQIEQGM